MSHFDTLLTENLCLLEINQLAADPNIGWLLIEAEDALKRMRRLQGQLSTGDIDQGTALGELGKVLAAYDFGDWDATNVKGQWQDLIQARQNGRIDQATFDRRLKEIKRDAFLYNTVFAIGRALFGKLAGPRKNNLEQAFKDEGMDWKSYNTNKSLLNWRQTGSPGKAQDLAKQLVELVGHRQALALLKQAA